MQAPKLDSGAALGFFWDVFKARPMVFIGLAVWTVVVYGAIGIAQLQYSADELAAFEAVSETDPYAVLSSMGAYFGALAPFMLIAMVVGIFIETAWLRLFMRGEGNPVFPFRFSAEEGHYTLTYLLLFLLFLVLYLGGVVVVGLIAFAFGLGGEALAAVGVFVGMIVFLAMLVFFTVRVSPALALAVSRRKVSLGLAWGGTKVMFWPLLGSFVLAILIAMVIGVVSMIVFLFMPFDMSGLDASREPVDWQLLVVPYALLYTVNLIPQSLFRGIACKAALTIEEANTPPAPPAGTVGEA